MAEATLGKVTLDVAGRKFVTLATTLEESDFLRVLVSEPWKHNRQADGSYFVDANPDVFEDILDYLRRGWKPLFWNRETGHDVGRYKKLQQEAEYLGIPRLVQWLKDAGYHSAVVHKRRIMNKFLTDNTEVSIQSSSSVVRQEVQMEWATRNLYTCLANGKRYGLDAYHSRFDKCSSGRCEKHRSCDYDNDARILSSVSVLIAAVSEESVEINLDACRPE